MLFRDLNVGEQFVFIERPAVPCEKTGTYTYKVIDTGQCGRVGVGDNNVVAHVPGELRRPIDAKENR